MSTFLSPPRWSPESLERDVAAAVDSFRREREQEPLGTTRPTWTNASGRWRN